MRIGEALRELRDLIWRYRGALTLGLALTLLNRLATFVLPALSKVTVDRVIAQHRLGLLGPIAMIGLAALVLDAVTTFVSRRVLGVAGQRAVTALRSELLLRVLGFPAQFFDDTRVGSLVSRIMVDTEHVENLMGSDLVQFVSAVTTAAIGFGVLLSLNWPLTLAVMAVLTLSTIWGTRTFAGLFKTFNAHGDAHARTTARLTETLGGIAVVKAYAAEMHESRAFATTLERLLHVATRAVTGVAWLSAGTALINGGLSLLLIVGGGWAVLRGWMTVGDLLVFIMLAALLATPFMQIATMGGTVGKAIAGLSRIRELRLQPEEDADELARVAVSDVVGTVEFERVNYRYVGGTTVLREISLHARPGSMVALVGPSGAGKSTLCRLLMAFDQPTNGRVLIDGRDLSSMRLRDYRRRLGVVMQDTFLFDGTVRDNIAFAAPGADDDRVQSVGRIAHCDEFVSRLPQGYDTIVGERGMKLSGGQRQRIAIARAILADPRILILDEATSNLDSESETFIRDGLRYLRAGRTTFVIAHRLSTIETADQILVLDMGEIVERGAHADLMRLNGRYRRLHDAQHGVNSRPWSQGSGPTANTPQLTDIKPHLS